MKERLEGLLTAGRSALQEAETLSALQEARVRFLGKKGEMTLVMKGMGQLGSEERPRLGALANQVKEELESLFDVLLAGRSIRSPWSPRRSSRFFPPSASVWPKARKWKWISTTSRR
jgi:phenylalanyl-tRNA synthetase alpha subunit